MSDEKEDLPKFLKDRIAKNRKKAIAVRNSKLVSHPYNNNNAKKEAVSVRDTDKKTIKIGAAKYRDTGGGFLLEEPQEIDVAEELRIFGEHFDADLPDDGGFACLKCAKNFAQSNLYDNFGYKCCDQCKASAPEEEFKLITKTEAIKMYLLKDCDFEKRQPPLKCITKKNPHNSRWGDMKLYLQVQVEERAVEVWGDLEAIEEEREKREEKRLVANTKKYQKSMKELRMKMRSSLYDRTSAASHTHDFGDEVYNEEDDTYFRSCKSCSYEETFEKM